MYTNTKTNEIQLIVNPKKYVINKEIIQELTDIARDGFGTAITNDDVKNHVLETDILYLIKDTSTGKLKGFSSYDIFEAMNKKILYLNGIVIRREFQKEGQFYKVNTKALSLNDFDYLAMRTQNPVIYASTQKIVKEIYPNDQYMPEEIRVIGTYIAKNYLKMNYFEEETFIGRGTYGTSLYDKIPHHVRADKYFDEKLSLDYSRGDSIVIIGKIK